MEPHERYLSKITLRKWTATDSIMNRNQRVTNFAGKSASNQNVPSALTFLSQVSYLTIANNQPRWFTIDQGSRRSISCSGAESLNELSFHVQHACRCVSFLLIVVPPGSQCLLLPVSVWHTRESLFGGNDKWRRESTADDGWLVSHRDLLCRCFVPLPLPGEQHESASCQQVAEEYDPSQD